MKRNLAIIAVAALFVPATMFAQGNSEEHKSEVIMPDHFDVTPAALRDMFQLVDRSGPARGGRDFEPGHPEAIGHTNPAFIDPLVASTTGSTGAFSVGNYAATGGTGVDMTARVAPPDTTGDLGPNHYVQSVNLRYAIYTLTRSSGAISGFNLVSGFPKNGNVLWQGFGGRCQSDNDGDPVVQYDQLHDRWILTQFAVSGTPYTQCVAISQTGDPTGSYYRYSYSFNRDFNDFPKMGVWNGSYVITYNMFKSGRSFAGSKVCAFETAKMLTGAAAPQVCAQTSNSYHSLLPADIEGTTLPSSTTVPLLSMSSSSIYYWAFTPTFGATPSATLSGPTVIPGIASFSRTCSGGTCIPQAGTTQQLDSLADRLNYRLSYRNFGDHESLLVNHSVSANGGAGIRWYEFRNAATKTVSNATPVVYQQGTYAPTSDYRWMGSAAMDKTGGIAVGYNVSSSSVKPSIRYAVHTTGDGLGVLGGETSMLAGPGVQIKDSYNLSRWGDYSTMSVDPVDGCTMVFTTEYIPSDGTFNWATWISSVKLSTCP